MGKIGNMLTNGLLYIQLTIEILMLYHIANALPD